ncbi:TPA: hypothetical protein GFX97_08065 [Escherichia coli]|nr:hypothetical protein [Escherichia coli]
MPQPEAHGRRKFNDKLSMNQKPRRALSCCVPAFNHIRLGGILWFPTNWRKIYARRNCPCRVPHWLDCNSR